MSRRAAIIGVIAVMSVVYGGAIVLIIHSEEWASAEIQDLSVPTTLVLNRSGYGQPSGITLWVTGHIDGEVELRAENWEPQRLSGNVDLKVYLDFFSNEYMILFHPENEAGGQLKIRYQFH